MIAVLFFFLSFMAIGIFILVFQLKRYWIRKFIEFCEDRHDWTGEEIARYIEYLNSEL